MKTPDFKAEGHLAAAKAKLPDLPPVQIGQSRNLRLIRTLTWIALTIAVGWLAVHFVSIWYISAAMFGLLMPLFFAMRYEWSSVPAFSAISYVHGEWRLCKLGGGEQRVQLRGETLVWPGLIILSFDERESGGLRRSESVTRLVLLPDCAGREEWCRLSRWLRLNLHRSE